MFNIFNKYGIDYKKDTNHAKVLKVLQKTPNQEVNAWDLVVISKVLHYTSAISTLRRKGYNIINKVDRQNKDHSFYTLITE